MNQENDSIQKFTIFVGGLNFQTDESSLKNFFTSFPQITGIESVRICRRIEGQSKGFGYVVFDNKPSFRQSLLLNGSLLDGKKIRIEVDNSKKIFFSSKNDKKESTISHNSSTASSPVKKKKSNSHSYSSSYSSYSYSSSSSSYSSYSSDSEKKSQSSRRKNKKRKRRDYSDYSYSS